MTNPDYFIIDSDFPMPSQTKVVSATLNIPAGTPPGGGTQTTVNIGNASIFRAAITSARLGQTFVGANDAVIRAGNDIYGCVLGVSASGTATLRVVIMSGSSTATAESIRFSLSCFTMP